MRGHARQRPERLAEKLKRIRTTLGLSQTELHKSLGVEEDIPYTRISDYELGKNVPTLIVLLKYARVAGVSWQSSGLHPVINCPPFSILRGSVLREEVSTNTFSSLQVLIIT